MTPTTVHVNLAQRSYDILVTSGDLAGVGPFARQRCPGQLALVVTDEHVLPHARAVTETLGSAGFQVKQVILPPGEAQKSLATAGHLYEIGRASCRERV